MNILITGVHGFVGSNLVKALCAKHTVYGVDIVVQHKLGLAKTYSWADLNENRIPAMDVIIHLAAVTPDVAVRCIRKPDFTVNLTLTQRVFDYFLASESKKFIFFSSVKAVANSVGDEVLDEEAIPWPVEAFGETKLKEERYIMGKFNMDDESWKRVYILRPCLIHGPGNKGYLNLLYNMVNKGIPWPLGAFGNERSFTSMDNLSFIIEGLVSGHVASGIYHIGDDQTISTNQLIELICESQERKARIWRLPKYFIRSVVVLGDLFCLPLNKVRFKKLTDTYVVNNSKIKRALGIESLPVNARKGLLDTFNSFKEESDK